MPQGQTTLLPPRTPSAWTWRCHECHSEYPLACTRRCFECGHTYCTALPVTKAGPEPKRRRSKKKKRRSCTAEFDYEGWATWGAYRRTVVSQEGAMVTASSESPRKWTRIGGDESKEIGSSNYDHNGELSESSMWFPVPDVECEDAARRKERMYVLKRHNCWLHCDSPSECLHARHTAWKEGRV